MAGRQDEQLRRAVNDVGADIGLPDAQRGHHAVAIVPTAVDGGARPMERTLRKLTRAERLLRSGAIDKHQAAAIDLYITAADAAYAGCVRASSLGEGGGSSPTGAAAAAHARQLDRAFDADRYQRARAALPPMHVAAFERIVLENHPIGQVGADLWPGSSKGAISGAIRQVVAQCADALSRVFERDLGPRDDLRGELIKTMQRFDNAVRATLEAESAPPAANTIADVVADTLTRSQPGDALYVSPPVAADLLLQAGMDDAPILWCGFPFIVVDHWTCGWLVLPQPVG